MESPIQRGPRAVPPPPAPDVRGVERVAAVVPSHHGRRWLGSCLAALAAQRDAAFTAVIVVDDGSTDGSVSWLAETQRGVDVVARPAQGGFACAANDGLRRAAALGCDAVALVNTDVELAEDWLARTIGALRPGDAAVACKMVSLADPGIIDDAGDLLRRDGAAAQLGQGHRDDGRWDAPGEAWGACAGAALYRLAPVLAAEGFDEELGQYLEDVDLALRLRLGGWNCAYAPAVARHANGGSTAALAAPVRFWVARNTLVIAATWFPVRWWPLVAYRNASWLAHAAGEGRGAATWQVRGVLAGVVAGGRRLRGRRARRATVTRPVEEAVPAVPWRGPRAANHPRGGDAHPAHG